MKYLVFLFLFVHFHFVVAQNVGIGTLSPQATLHVKGNMRTGGAASYMRFDSLSGKIEWVNANLFVPVTQALMKHSAAADGLFYNNSNGITGQLEYRNALGEPVFYTNFINSKGYFKGRLGVSTTNPLAGLHVADSSVLFSATGTIPPFAAAPPVGGAGRRMMWYPDKAAFRAGYVPGNQWDAGNIGNYSFATGHSNVASGNFSTAFGVETFASGTVSTAMGNASFATGEVATAIGLYCVATGESSTAIGVSAFASGLNSLSMGNGSTASGENSIAIGTGNTSSGLSSVAVGENTIASGYYSTAMGIGTTASSYYSTAMGGGTTATGTSSTAMGHFTTAKALGALSIGVLNDNSDGPDEFIPDPTDRLFQIGNGTDEFSRSNALTVLRNGNLGLGVLSPSFPLSFAPLLGDKISLWSNSSNSYGFGIQGALLQIHTDVLGSDIAFGYGSSIAFTENMRIRGNGNVGIGTTNPNAPLGFPATLGKKITLYPGVSGDVGLAVQGNQFLIYSDHSGATVRLGYDQGGVFQYNLDVFGNGNATLRGNLTQLSDQRLKKDIRPLVNSLDRIILLNGYHYYWKEENADNNIQTGVLAQEVQKIFPELVNENEEGFLSVNYSGLIPVLIESIKAQQQLIEKQQEQIDLLISQVHVLQSK